MNAITPPSVSVPTVAAPQAAAHAEHPAREALRMFLRNPSAIAGMAMLLIVLLVAIAGPWIWPADPFEIRTMPLSPPFSEEAWLGSDQLGRDVLTGIIHGGRATLMVGAFAALLSVCIGVTLGAMAGYYGGRVDALLMRVTEFFQVLPALLFAMVVVTLFSPSLVTVTLAIGSVSWPATARLTRAEFMRIRGLDYVKAARVAGARDSYLMSRVILPAALPPVIVAAALTTGSAILFEAGLSFLGLGDANRMSWGLIIGQNKNYLLDAWWTVAAPGFAIFLTVLAISLIGDGINDALNPRQRKR